MRTLMTGFLITVSCPILMAQTTLPTHVATTPSERLKEEWWKKRHDQRVEMTQKGGLDLVFIGDSITQGWEGGGKAVWQKYYGSRNAGNFGFSGDRTEHVLWRMENGEITGLQPAPKAFVIMIGTNNIGHRSSTPEQTADGVKAIVAKLREGFPTSKILLLAIFPRSASPEDDMRKKVVAASEGFKGIADGNMIHFLDIGGSFLEADGTLPKSIMPDLLHLNGEGYERWAQAIEPTLKSLLGE